MKGFKIYYEIQTGNVILTIPENPNANAVSTAKEQDFAMYSVLQARNPETIDLFNQISDSFSQISKQLGHGNWT